MLKVGGALNATPSPNEADRFSREELERFLQAFTHEIRNRLNTISLEAADMAEQAGPQVDATRLQQRVQDCSVFLKKVRDLQAAGATLDELVKKLKEKN